MACPLEANSTWSSGVRLASTLGCSPPRPAARRAAPGMRQRTGRGPHDPAEQLAEGRVARQVDPQHQGVDEEADQPLELGAGAAWRSACRRRCRPGRRSASSSTAKAASSVMKSVAPSRRAERRAPARAAAGGRRTDTVAPRKVCTAGRGRSVGSSSAAGRRRAARASSRAGLQHLALAASAAARPRSRRTGRQRGQRRARRRGEAA